MDAYYYLVAGLPDITLEDGKLSYTVDSFKSEIYPADNERNFYLKERKYNAYSVNSACNHDSADDCGSYGGIFAECSEELL